MRSLATKITIAFAPMITLYGVNLVLNAFRVYEKISYIDNPMHTLGGTAAAWSGLLLYKTLKQKYPQMHIAPQHLFFASLVGFSALIGVLWEHYEYLHDVLLYSHMQSSIGDTMKDLALDITGAIIFCIILSRRLRTKKLKPGEY